MKLRNSVQCSQCGKFIASCGISNHMIWHRNQLQKKESTYNLPQSQLFCQYCSKQCKNLNSLKQHEIRCPENSEKIPCDYLTQYVRNNIKGRTKYNCDVIQKWTTTLQNKRKSGWVQPKYTRDPVIHVHQQHNMEEIQKWVNYVSKLSIDFPSYKTYRDGEYVVVSDNFLTNQYNGKYGTSTILHEHVYFMMLVFKDEFFNTNAVHHLDENKSNNSLSNLILFESVSDHTRFHKSKLAYLLYDETTHKFSCILK